LAVSAPVPLSELESRELFELTFAVIDSFFPLLKQSVLADDVQQSSANTNSLAATLPSIPASPAPALPAVAEQTTRSFSSAAASLTLSSGGKNEMESGVLLV